VTSTSAITFHQVSKRYGARAPTLSEVSFAVGAGEFFGLVGINGAGKTTLIKGLLDLHEMSAGSIRIFGTEHTQPSARARLAFLPERFIPPHYLKGRDFLRMMLSLYRQEADEQGILGMLSKLDLEPDVLDKPVRTFSKGMTQKLGLAACFLADRDLTVLDEPMSGLDPKARALVKDQLSAMKARGKTLFFTSHALADIEEICAHMAVLHGGRLRYLGAPAGLLKQTGAATLERAFLDLISTNASTDAALQ
jgi:ABC-2 type transport system ATP-binding protein